ncbi:MAG: tRNA (adenosine(37)-N6)-threonylcarbamoyltransferase complex dimerization subunit type 1 TsaB [Pirellulales bacterium]|nr:tRNA (adenosine(37)-N6)-threonylcarbamoyltransferase complex dimerization subunit type 1 TsaB [Pirellulales bacterium]
MKLLALDTSGRRGSLALAEIAADACWIVAEARLPAVPRAAQSLLPTLRQLLAEHAWIPDDVGVVAVTAGPGSFTGLRLGVTTAKTLAFATGAELAAVPTLAALAWGSHTDRRPVWGVLDAQRDEVFAARFTSDPGGEARDECQVLPIEAWLSLVEPGEAVATPAAGKLADRLPAGVELVARDDGPTPTAVATLGGALWRAGRTVDPLQLVPWYHRRSAAEEKAL